mmetsp:Transcript_23354/g.29859  ORF Transcript_23354/g.29859 Transcript_23354/m.29859 type:complete len:87 (+) Transcript_23354:3-263(+)
MPWYLYYPNKIFSIFVAVLQKSPRSGAYCSVYCAVAEDAKKTIRNNDKGYFVNSELRRLEKLALDENDAKKLWDLSSELVSIALEK